MEVRIPESLPSLHDKVLAAAAEAAISFSLDHKKKRLPPPGECDLYYVNRDTFFSYHKDSELFLQRMMALYVASHYKNSPNDLQLMANAPAHHLFVLLGLVDESRNHLPDILCVIQDKYPGGIQFS